MKKYYSKETGFYGNYDPNELLIKYGSPLYVYNEKILRERCREMANLVAYPNFRANFSIKANSNLEIIKIVKEEGLSVDAVSMGEIFLLLHAGFDPSEIFFVANNVCEEEMAYAVKNKVLVSADSIAQIRQFGRLFPGEKLAVRFNPGVGAGHHEKVITAGSKTKFGVGAEHADEVKSLCKEYNIKLVGINQHIGSLFLDEDLYIAGVKSLLQIAEKFDDLEFVDMGGGFGIPYHKQDGQERLNLEALNEKLTVVIEEWVEKYGKKVMFKSEPGRYCSAECGVLLGRVHAIKENGGKTYIGTDLGFNTLVRPTMYDSHHDVEVYNRSGKLIENQESKQVTVVGNICESGDIIAKDRKLPTICEGDIIGVMDSGAYGYAMSSNYNSRLRPAEVMICEDGDVKLIRRRDTFEDLLK